jgi:PAS domain S-box-containing protein
MPTSSYIIASAERDPIVKRSKKVSTTHDDRSVLEALAVSEARFEFAEEAGEVGMWDWDVGTNETWWTPTLFRLLGQTPTNAMQTFDSFMQSVHPEDRERLLAETAQAISERRPFYAEFRVIWPDGQERWLVGRGKPMLNADNGVERMMGVNLDITDRKRAEQHLFELNATLESRVESQTAERERFWALSDDLMLVAFYDGRILRANPASARLGAQDNKRLSDIIETDDWPRFQNAIDKMRQSAPSIRVQTRVISAKGDVREVAWGLAPDPINDRFIAVGRDITDVLAARARMRETEARLEQVQRMETLGELASGVAHDFNNLLVPIFGVLDMLKRRPQGDDDFDALIRGASKAAGNAREMVRRLLTFSQRQHAGAEPINIAVLLTNMGDLLRHTLPQSIELSLSLSDDLPEILINSTQLELSLLNLAINARDAMPKGGLLKIAARPMADSDSCVTLTVTDTGEGMDEATLERAAEAFFTTKSSGKGTGLGLFMARRLAEQVGGSLEITSVLGKGTCVSLHLPATGTTAPHVEKPNLGLGFIAADEDNSH